MTQSTPKKGKRFQERQALIDKATAGDAGAQLLMGDFYREGDELIPQDLAEAVKWYRLAAKQGHAEAQNNLGAMYQHGMGVPVNMAEAVKWYRLAAGQKVPVAKFNLGILLQQGLGVAPDPAEGLRLMTEAAEAGYSVAQYELGQMFRIGDGVPVDLAKAAEYFVKAAGHGDKSAQEKLSDLERPLQELAMSGNKDAAWRLKEMYQFGLGVPKSLKASRQWGKLFVTIDNVSRPADLIQVLTISGDLEFPLYDDFVRPAPGDDRYSLEWMYQTGNDKNYRDRHALFAYRAKRNAGMPPPSAAAWPKDDWRKWQPAPGATSPSADVAT